MASLPLVSAPVVSLVVEAVDAGRLARVLPGLAAQAPAAQLVVVGPDIASLADVVRTGAPDALLIQAPHPANFPQARNLGAGAADAPWLLFLDEGVGLQRSLAIRPQAGVVLAAAGSADRGLLVAADDFQRAEGYDEIIGDPQVAQADLLLRLAQAGVKRATLPAHGLTRLPALDVPVPPPRPEDGLYQRIKSDLVRLGSIPDAASRHALLTEIRAALARAADRGGAAEMHVHFRHARAGASATRASLTYGIKTEP